jgi:hypothetical protein
MKRGGRLIRILMVVEALAFLVFLVVPLVCLGLSFLAAWLVDCEPGYHYSISHGRCGGNLEFDIKPWYGLFLS